MTAIFYCFFREAGFFRMVTRVQMEVVLAYTIGIYYSYGQDQSR